MFTTAQWRHLYKMIMLAYMRVEPEEFERIAECGVIIRRNCNYPR